MTELKKLIAETLQDQAKKKLGLTPPTHAEKLLEDINSINRMVTALNYIYESYPDVFEQAYQEALKNDNR
tara:strand:- start:1020 stop:1229 length:210 start_codon:yes stop_codon:yes gene_type:complete